MARTSSRPVETVEFEDTPEETAAPAETPTVQSDRFVQYTGGASTREITRSQWARAGVANQADSSWTIENRHLLSLEHFSTAAIDVLMMDGKFKIVTADEVS